MEWIKAMHWEFTATDMWAAGILCLLIVLHIVLSVHNAKAKKREEQAYVEDAD